MGVEDILITENIILRVDRKENIIIYYIDSGTHITIPSPWYRVLGDFYFQDKLDDENLRSFIGMILNHECPISTIQLLVNIFKEESPRKLREKYPNLKLGKWIIETVNETTEL